MVVFFSRSYRLKRRVLALFWLKVIKIFGCVWIDISQKLKPLPSGLV